MHKFTPDLRAALTDTIAHANEREHYLAMQSRSFLTRIGLLPKVEKWLATNAPRVSWHCGEVFHGPSGAGELYPLIDALERQHVIVVGPPWLETLPFCDEFVPVKPYHCWDDVDEIEARLRETKDAVVSLSAGPTAKVLVQRLYPVIGGHSWLIDFGSLWDVYCGKRSRQYHKQMTKKIIKKNLGQ